MTKPDCVLVHGWGMPLTIFEPLIARLGEQVNFRVVRLPGDTSPSSAQGWQAYLEFVLAQTPERAYWLGWSFGGMLALQAAYYFPERIRGLFLVTATPKFVQTENWPGVAPEVLAQFHAQLYDDYQKTMRQFLALQVLYASEQKALTKALHTHVTPHPDIVSLSEQLQLLDRTDLRPQLSEILQPSVWLMGDKDLLTPAKAGVKASQMMPHARAIVLAGCGHLPFWTHAAAFDQQLLDWINHG